MNSTIDLTEHCLEKFNMDSLESDSSVLIVGKRGTGKTILIRDILYHNRDIPYGTIISPTDYLYNEYIPKIFIHNKYRHEIGRNIINRQRDMIEKCHDKLSCLKDADFSAFCVFDDSLYFYDGDEECVKHLYMYNTCYKTLLINSTTNDKNMNPELRKHIDYVFIFRSDNMSDRKSLYDKYYNNNVFTSFEMFDFFMNKYTNDNNCIVINKNSNKIYWYKAETNDDFRIGGKLLWNECV